MVVRPTTTSIPRVMKVAHDLAGRCLPRHYHPCSRRDFTLPQLLACLCAREVLGKSFRVTEQALRDGGWCEAIGMTRTPDHNTLQRAMKRLVDRVGIEQMLDLQTRLAADLKWVGRTLAVDSTHYDTHHRSRHYERRCRKTAGEGDRSEKAATSVKNLPKLGIGVCATSGLVLSARAPTGAGSDAPWFEPLVFDAWRRTDLRTVVADAGFDGESNHRIAQMDMGLRSVIPPLIGRPWRGRKRPPSQPLRRVMHGKFNRDGGGVAYRRRSTVECVNSMMKRNPGDTLRSRTRRGREMEMLLRSVVHNTMILRRRRGLRQSRSGALFGLIWSYLVLFGRTSPDAHQA